VVSWLGAAPAVVVALVALVLPGLAVATAAGLRGIPAWGAATPLSVSVLAVGAVAAGLVGASWGPVPALAATALAVLLAWGIGRLLGQRRGGDPGWFRGTGLSAGVLGAGLCAAAVVAGIGAPDRVPQTFDAVFHLNAVRRAVETGAASSLGLGALASPERPTAFYPGAWHAVAVLVAQACGSPVVAASAVSVALAMVWPFGCLALVRHVVGASVAPLVAGGVLAGAFGAAPFLLLSYGTVWPNALGTVLLPSVLGAAVGTSGLSAQDTTGVRRSALVVAAALPGLLLSHPNAVVALAVYAVPLTAVSLALGRLDGLPLRRPALWGLWGAGCAALLWFVTRSSVFAATRGTDWRAAESLAQAAGEALLVAPRGLPVPAVAAVLLLVGVLAALHTPRLAWLVGAHAAAAALFVLAAGSDSPLAQALTGPWYNDAFRLGALLPVTAVPLAALGAAATSRWVTFRWAAARPVPPARTAADQPGTPGGARARTGHELLVRASAVVVTALLAGLQGAAIRDNAMVVARWYGDAALAGPEEQELFSRLRSVVPEDSVIAGNPWNGSALAEAVGGRRVLFPHLSGSWGDDRSTVATSLVEVRHDPVACDAVRRLGVEYVLDGKSAFWHDDPRQRLFAGLDVSEAEGFRPVASGGRLTLYRVPTCPMTTARE
jgi:hypothetical protein